MTNRTDVWQVMIRNKTTDRGVWKPVTVPAIYEEAVASLEWAKGRAPGHEFEIRKVA